MAGGVSASVGGGGYSLGSLIGTIGFKIPEKESQKMDALISKQPELDKLYKSFSRGGAATVATAGTMIGAAVMLVTSGSGFKAILGALWDLIGLVSDLIFVALWPVIKPLLDAFVEMSKKLLANSKGPGGIFGALMDPVFWLEIALLFLEGILKAGAKLFELGAQIAVRFLMALTNPDPAAASGLNELGARVGKAFVEFLMSAIDFIVAWANVFIQGLLKAGTALAELWTQAANVMLDVFAKARDVWIQIAQFIAEGIMQWLTGGINTNIGNVLPHPVGSGQNIQGGLDWLGGMLTGGWHM